MHTVIFWFDYPPKVEKGGFNAFSQIWDGKVIYVFSNDSRAERKAAKWDNGEYGKAVVVQLYEAPDRKDAVLSLLGQNLDAIHVANGFDTPIMKEVKNHLFKKNSKIILFTERPTIMGGFFERLYRRCGLWVKYSKLYREYKPYVKAYLPMGVQGMQRFHSCGIPYEKMYNFLYCPDLTDISNRRDFSVSKPIRFLYVGRFFYKTKGTDILVKALKYLHGSWSLDMAGGYGSDADEVKQNIAVYSQVRYVGIWDSSQVVRNMQDYDIVVVPSKADGWNLLINEGLHAGICVITSDEAVSHEVIDKCKAGLIFRSERPKELAKCMQYAIDNPDDVQQWMKQGRGVAKTISQERIGQYIKDIIEYEFFNVGEKPLCPWL